MDDDNPDAGESNRLPTTARETRVIQLSQSINDALASPTTVFNDSQVARLRAADRRIKRIVSRNPLLSASAQEFETIDSAALKIYLDPTTWRPDLAGDEELQEMIANPFDAQRVSVRRMSELTTRPYYLCKVNPDLGTESGAVAFSFFRPIRVTKQNSDRLRPFEVGDEFLMFDRHTQQPVLRATMAEITQDVSYNAASGTLWLVIEALVDE